MTGYLDHDGPILFAHRGGALLWPENTDRSFRGALELGYRYIETDLHTTRDGVIVCFHDDSVDRTTDGSGPVKAHSLAELKSLDAGYRFTPDGKTFPFRGEGCRVPTLEEAMAMHPDLRLNVEIKQRSPDVVAPLWRLIEARGWHDRLLVAAADDAVGDAFRNVCRGRVRTSAGIRGVQRFWAEAHLGVARLRAYRFDALQVPRVHGKLPVVTRRFVREAHRQGIRVHVWTIDDPAEMRGLLDLGVDGIMTDRPDVLVDVARER